jgi:hypothetical protein
MALKLPLNSADTSQRHQYCTSCELEKVFDSFDGSLSDIQARFDEIDTIFEVTHYPRVMFAQEIDEM